MPQPRGNKRAGFQSIRAWRRVHHLCIFHNAALFARGVRLPRRLSRDTPSGLTKRRSPGLCPPHFPCGGHCFNGVAMSEKNVRRPFSNFFIKKSIQFGIIGKILFVVFLSTALTTLMLAIAYNAKSQGGSFYYMSNNIMEDLELQSILGIILPALISAQMVSLAIGLWIGFFSSRKVAVPIYKIEKWAAQLRNGKLNTHLAFRESQEMKELTIQCNAVADTYKRIFGDINESVEKMQSIPEKPSAVASHLSRIRGILDEVDFR
jgi:methyl-accepting chemotaxis protein